MSFANTLVVSTILLLCYAKSCFLQQEISTFWPNSSKHLLCPLMLEGPISNVYHLLLLLPPHYFGPIFCQRTSFPLWIKKKYSGVTFGHLVCIGKICCF